KGADQHQAGDEDVFGPVVGQLRNVPEVVHDPAHQVPYLGIVKKAEIQGLQVGKQVFAHAVLDVYSHHMAVVVHEVHAHQAQHIEDHHYSGPDQHSLQVAVRNKILHEGSGENGEQKIQDCDDAGREQIRK